MKKFFLFLFPLSLLGATNDIGPLMTYNSVSNYLRTNTLSATSIDTNLLSFSGGILSVNTNWMLTNVNVEFFGGYRETNYVDFLDLSSQLSSFADKSFVTNYTGLTLSNYIARGSVDTNDFAYDGVSLVLQTNWDDVTISASSVPSGPSEPAFQYLTGSTNLQVRIFQGGGSTEDRATFTFQFPHSYVEGSNIKPHIHCITTNQLTASSNVVFSLEYRWIGIGQSVTNDSIIIVTNAVPTNSCTHFLIDLGTITNSGQGISSQFIGELKRRNSNASDNLDYGLGFLDFDVHVLVNSLGSVNETSK